MIRAICKSQTFMLCALDGSTMRTRPNEVNEIDEKFTLDITYRMAVKAGAIEPIQTDKQARAALETPAPETPAPEAPEAPKAPAGKKGKAKADDAG